VTRALRQDVVLAPDDGSLGPLLRLADDRLAPGAGYGRHAHRAVDVVAVVLAGSLVHRWERDTPLRAGDLALLRAGSGLEHDEVAGDDGARVLQAYLRAAEPGAAPSHEVHRAPRGWVDLGRPDARLWVGTAEDDLPAGEVVVGGRERGTDLVVVWRLTAVRPDWAAF
jgi:redox-sensitive bicupin YhaK (pirin superfamily)